MSESLNITYLSFYSLLVSGVFSDLMGDNHSVANSQIIDTPMIAGHRVMMTNN
jgi:hypothetical protein